LSIQWGLFNIARININTFVNFRSIVITMSEQQVPSAIAQRIIIKFLYNEDVKPNKILRQL